MPGLPATVNLSFVQHLAAPVLALALVASATPPAEAPDAATTADVAALAAAAVEIAHELRAVPADRTDQLCDRDDLAVSWQAPTGFTHGAHITPVGPAPVAATRTVNGVVVCGTSTWAYMGFVAERADEGWALTPVPYVEESHDHDAPANYDADPEALADDGDADPHAEDGHADGGHADDEHAHGEDAATTASATQTAAPLPSPSAPTRTVTSDDWLAGLGPIEGYARHEPQTTCSPSAKPGTIVLRDTLLGTHRATRNLGISRACHIGGRSEHKEGRAFDWGAYVHRPVERASVDRFLAQLMATDADGNRHALARRMGVMYVIWNGRIWSASRAGDGWRRYSGPSPHTDHVHISLNRAGGAGRTSFYTKNLAAAGVLGLVPPGGTVGAGETSTTPTAGSPVSGTPAPTRTPSRTPSPSPSPTRPPSTSAPTGSKEPTKAPSDGSTNDGSAARRAEEERRAAEEEARRKAAAEAERKAAAEAERQRKAEAEAQRKAAAEAERQRKAEAEAQRKAAAEAERQRKAAAEQQREAEKQRRRSDASSGATASGPGKGGGKRGKGGKAGKG